MFCEDIKAMLLGLSIFFAPVLTLIICIVIVEHISEYFDKLSKKKKKKKEEKMDCFINSLSNLLDVERQRVKELEERLEAKNKRIEELEKMLDEQGLSILDESVFDLPDCPCWANYAVVNFHNCLTFFEKKPSYNSFCDYWYTGAGIKFFIDNQRKYRTNDWREDIIERPKKERCCPCCPCCKKCK